MRGRSWLVVALAAVGCVASLLMAVPAAAQGDATEFRYRGRSWESPAGEVLYLVDVGPDWTTSQIRAVSPSGASRPVLDVTGTHVDDVTFSPDGDIYTFTINREGVNTGTLTRLADDGSVLARRAIAEPAYGDLEYGADGTLYLATWQHPSLWLHLFDSADLTVRHERVRLPVSGFSPLAAREDGLALYNYDGEVIFLPYGFLDQETVNAGRVRRPDSTDGHNIFSVGPDRATYTLRKVWDRTTGSYTCGDSLIWRQDPIEGNAWMQVASAIFGDHDLVCEVADIEALPDGGAVATATVGHDLLVAWIAPDGTLQRPVLTHTPPMEGPDWFNPPHLEAESSDVHVDGSGIVLAGISVPITCPETPERLWRKEICSRADIVGLLDGVEQFTRSIHPNHSNQDPYDDSVALHVHWSAVHNELSLSDGMVRADVHYYRHLCLSGCVGRTDHAVLDVDVTDRWWSDPPTPRPDVGPCTDVRVIGVRGSGESQTANDGFGGTVGVAVDWFRDTYTGTVTATALRYPAHPVSHIVTSGLAEWLEGVEVGVIALHRALGHARRQCGDQPIVLLGYSQGAWVINRALQRLPDPDALDNIAYVGLIADPARVDQASYNSPTTPGRDGIAVAAGQEVRRMLPEQLWDRAWSVCVDTDTVCHHAPNPVEVVAVLPTHGSYRHGLAQLVGVRAAERIPAPSGE